MSIKYRRSAWEISPFGPPSGGGVYIIMCHDSLTNKKTPLYIGSSKNIAKRILSEQHYYYKLFRSAKPHEGIYTKFKVCNDYLELEKRLIYRLQPKYNVQHKRLKV